MTARLSKSTRLVLTMARQVVAFSAMVDLLTDPEVEALTGMADTPESFYRQERLRRALRYGRVHQYSQPDSQ